MKREKISNSFLDKVLVSSHKNQNRLVLGSIEKDRIKSKTGVYVKTITPVRKDINKSSQHMRLG